jgi:pre-rRNA-processing protein TSR1
MKESLQSENIPDPMECEQTWPAEEELVAAEGLSRVVRHRIKKVPKGMSEYQAAWIPDSDAGEMHCCSHTCTEL